MTRPNLLWMAAWLVAGIVPAAAEPIARPGQEALETGFGSAQRILRTDPSLPAAIPEAAAPPVGPAQPAVVSQDAWSTLQAPDAATLAWLARRVPGLDLQKVRSVGPAKAEAVLQQAVSRLLTYLELLTEDVEREKAWNEIQKNSINLRVGAARTFGGAEKWWGPHSTMVHEEVKPLLETLLNRSREFEDAVKWRSVGEAEEARQAFDSLKTAYDQVDAAIDKLWAQPKVGWAYGSTFVHDGWFYDTKPIFNEIGKRFTFLVKSEAPPATQMAPEP